MIYEVFVVVGRKRYPYARAPCHKRTIPRTCVHHTAQHGDDGCACASSRYWKHLPAQNIHITFVHTMFAFICTRTHTHGGTYTYSIGVKCVCVRCCVWDIGNIFLCSYIFNPLGIYIYTLIYIFEQRVQIYILM